MHTSVVDDTPTRLFRGMALADGRTPDLTIGVSVLVERGQISWIRPVDAEEEVHSNVEVVDASGTTLVPGLVDSHAHLTLPGGARWLERAADSTETLLAVAEHNAKLLRQSGVRWVRDVGSPVRVDPHDGRTRALSLGIRDRWRGKHTYPHIRAAGGWLTKAGSLPDGVAVEARTADELMSIAMAQLDDGSDLVKLYLDGPDANTSPWTTSELAAVISAVHERSAKVTGHTGKLAGAREAVAAGIDCFEHGFELDADVCQQMATRGVSLVSTLAVLRSQISFGATTYIPRFSDPDGKARAHDRFERARESVRLAHNAGVAIAAGTDLGGGSTRANNLPWEVRSLVDAGLEPWEALGSATWRGGDLLGEVDAGSVRAGGPADFALVHGDPYSDPESLWRIWRLADD